MDDSIARIRRWKGLIELREQRDKTTEIGMAQSLVTPEGSKWQGYAATNKRLHFGALRTLFAIQHERLEVWRGDLGGLDRDVVPAVVPAESGEPQDLEPKPGETPAVENQNENGAVVTQIVAPAGGNNPVAPAPAALLPAASPLDQDPLVAVIEKYQKEFDHLREYGL